MPTDPQPESQPETCPTCGHTKGKRYCEICGGPCSDPWHNEAAVTKESQKVTEESRARQPDFVKLAGDVHDRIHEVAALVNYHTGVEIGWAPSNAIPLLAEALREAFQSGERSMAELAAQLQRWQFMHGDQILPPCMSLRPEGDWVKYEDVLRALSSTPRGSEG